MSRSEAARERWSRTIEGQRASGLSATAFCADRAIPLSSFFAWKRRLHNEAARPSGAEGAAAGFVEARVRDGGSFGAVTVHLAGGRCVTVARGFDRELLVEVIDALESGASGPLGEAGRGAWGARP